MNKPSKTPEQALSSLMNLCARAERSSGDARRLMARWGVEPDAAAGVLSKLIEMKFIDDSRYAAAYVREKSNLSGWGPYKIKAGLSAKGIDRQTVADALSSLDSSKDRDILRNLLQAKMKGLKYTNLFDAKNKLLRYGLSRGFGYDAVYETVNAVVGNDDDM